MGWATATAAGLATLLFTVSAWAIPPVLTVQGRLTDNAGQAGEGSYTLTFRLYDADTGDGVIWEEIQPSVDVNGGVFEAPLGANAGNPLLPDFFLDNPQVWLGITVEAGPGVPNDGDPELPRQPLTTVGYAFAAQHAEGAGHADTADNAISAGNADTAETAAVASALDCNACVGTVQLAFDPATQTELDQALANIQFPTTIEGLSGGTIDGDVIVQGQLSAGSILQK
ncbi:MAG: hypothetical protein VX938_04190, partial [Myxococcota bacterium]|nr:hypothetical protein [Myxococcota bacterium]